jgi:GMP synthase-like glutamine amidotransferase
MVRRRIAFLDVEPDARWSDQIDMFRRILSPELQLEHFRVYLGGLPVLREFDGAIICGSNENIAPSPPPFVQPLIALLRECDRIREIRIVGVCFGAQIIAHALGGEVRTCQTPVCGSVRLRFSNPTIMLLKLYGIDSSECTILSTHAQCIHRLPTGSTILASSGSTRHECFMAGRYQNMLGLQSHPEYTREVLQDRLGCDIPSFHRDEDKKCTVALIRAFIEDWGALTRAMATSAQIT